MKKELYTPQDLESVDFENDIGYPGKAPYTRGVYDAMYTKQLWTMRQYAGFGTSTETNKRFRYLLEQGQTGLSVAFDLPTQIGYDSDNPMCKGEVGKVGVSIDTLADMEDLFQDIPIENISTSMTINSTAIIVLAMYIALAEKRNLSLASLRGTTQNDILKEYVARGTYIFPPKPSLKLIVDIFQYCSQKMPKWNTISISGYHIREAGSNAVQEVAFTLADGIEYVKLALESGLKIDDFAPRLSFFFNSSMNFFEEIAKFRAARWLWSNIITNRFHSTNEKSKRMRFHTQTSGASLTAQQPENNIIRVTLAALSAVLGGTQSLHTNSFDEALSLPTEKAVRIALRTQQILGYETSIPSTIDPIGGSYFVENKTKEICNDVEKYLQKIDEMGGMVHAIETGYIQKEIQDHAYKLQVNLDAKIDKQVGVNCFVEESEQDFTLLKVDPKNEHDQIAKLHKIKNDRDNEKVQHCLAHLQNAVQAGDNLMQPIIDAVKEYATIEEIANILRKEYGEYTESIF
ncbi:MAG: methylmalonyl-CoA mutase family protein [Caldisericia bacterium]|nr:methylmalonyl-CoA mutase family protein [Caldisericia bacterium]